MCQCFSGSFLLYYFSSLLLFSSKSGCPRAKEGVGETPSFRILITDRFWSIFELFHIDCLFCMPFSSKQFPSLLRITEVLLVSLICLVRLSFHFLHPRFLVLRSIFLRWHPRRSQSWVTWYKNHCVDEESKNSAGTFFECWRHNCSLFEAVSLISNCYFQTTLITRHSNPGVVWFEARGSMIQNVSWFSTNVLYRFPGGGGEASESPAGRPEEKRSGPESQGQERFALLDPPTK